MLAIFLILLYIAVGMICCKYFYNAKKGMGFLSDDDFVFTTIFFWPIVILVAIFLRFLHWIKEDEK